MSLSKVLRWNSELPPTSSTIIPVVTSVRPAEASARVQTDDVKGPDDFLDAARHEAQMILSEAQTRAQQILEDAKAEGFAVGLAEAQASLSTERRAIQEERDENQRSYEKQVNELTQLAEQVETMRAQRIERALEPLPKFCMDVVRQVLYREIELAPANIESMVSEMIQYLLDSSKVEVRVHPSDYAVALAAHPAWQSAKYGDWEVVVVPDSDIAPGGCEVRSESGHVDGTLSVKLDMLQAELDAAFERGGRT